MTIKNKKAMEGGTWWIIIGAIVAIMVAGIILFIVKEGLFAGKDSVDFLGDCKGQNGVCESKTTCDEKGPQYSKFYKLGGCTGATDYCCIPKQT